MRKTKVVVSLFAVFVLTICSSFIASAEESMKYETEFSQKPFENFRVGESYKSISDGKFYDTAFPFTVDHNGNIYLICAANRSRQLMVHTPSGEYLYSIWLPGQKYELSTDEKENHIYVACSAAKTVLKFDDNGMLLDIIHEPDLNSDFYDTPFSPKVDPFGTFRKEQTSKNVTIFLTNGRNKEVYFRKNFDTSCFDMISSILVFIVCGMLFVVLLEGVIYKIKTKGKITDAFFFSRIKMLYNKCQEAKRPQNELRKRD